MSYTRKIKAGLVKIGVNDFVGEDGNIFFDIDDGVLRLSDGVTPGGIPLATGSSEGGASTFRQLLDTPNSFAGAAGRFVKVNTQASALEFVDVSLFDGDYNSLTNLPTLFNPSAITTSLIPQTNEAIDLGTSSLKWRDLYLSGSTIYLGNAVIRNVDGTVELPVNAKVNGKKIPTDIRDLDDVDNLLSGIGVTSYNNLTDKPTLFSGNYNDLTNKPTIPTDISDLTDTNNVLASSGAGYSLPIATNNSLGGIKIGTGLSINGSGVLSVTAVGVTSYNDLTDTPDLTVYQLSATAFSGAYADLSGLPTLFDGAYASLTGTPDLSVYQLAINAFSGSYTDLTDKPTIPTVPTNISAFTNDAGYLTTVGTISYNDLSNLPTLFSGSYADLTNKPTIPTDIGDLTDTSGLLSAATFDGSFTSLTNVPTTLEGYGIATEVGTAISTAVNNVLDGAPALLDTLNEIAAAVGDDPNFVTTINTAIALKANTADLSAVATSNDYNDLTNLPVIPADVAELSDTLKSIIPNAEYETFAMAIMMG